MKYYKILLFLFIIPTSSCYVIHRPTVKVFSYCYNNSKTGIDSLIKINGYYKIGYIFTDGKVDRKEMIVFFDDGIFLISNNIDRCTDSKEEIETECLINNCDIGLYKISGDTIKGQYIFVGSTTSGCETIMYKVVDKKTIERIFSGDCDTPPKEFQRSYSLTDAKFKPCNHLPNPYYTKPISKKWFWCDKEKYKQWKKEHKRN